MMIEINLIPDVKKELLKANKTRNVVVTSSIFVGIAAVGVIVALGLVILGQIGLSKGQDNAIESESKTLSGVTDLSKMLTIQNQLSAIPGVNNGKPITSRALGLLDVVQRSGQGQVEISNFNLDIETATIEIEGHTSAGYPGVEAIVKTLNAAEISYSVRPEVTDEKSDEEDATASENKSEINSVPLLSQTATSGEVTYGRDSDGNETARFHLLLTLTEEFMSVKHENMLVRIKNGGNVTDSYLGIPKSIFAPAATDIKKEGDN